MNKIIAIRNQFLTSHCLYLLYLLSRHSPGLAANIHHEKQTVVPADQLQSCFNYYTMLYYQAPADTQFVG